MTNQFSSYSQITVTELADRLSEPNLQLIDVREPAELAIAQLGGFVNLPLTVGDVYAVALFKECSPGVYRTSLRSKGEVNVAKVAEHFGGGGHRNAAGCTLKGTWDEIENQILPLLQDAVKRANGSR